MCVLVLQAAWTQFVEMLDGHLKTDLKMQLLIPTCSIGVKESPCSCMLRPASTTFFTERHVIENELLWLRFTDSLPDWIDDLAVFQAF